MKSDLDKDPKKFDILPNPPTKELMLLLQPNGPLLEHLTIVRANYALKSQIDVLYDVMANKWSFALIYR